MRAIVQTLQAIEHHSDDAAAAEARGLLVNIQRWKFCATLASMLEVLSAVHCLSQQLQNGSIDYVAACGVIQATRSSLIQLRTDESWTGILQEADRLTVEAGISVQQERPTRTTSGNSKLDAFFVSSSFGQRSSTTRCPRDTLKIDMFFATIDRMLVTDFKPSPKRK